MPKMYPITDVFIHHPMKQTVQNRIMRLNPAEVEQATKIRGYFRRPRSWRSAKRQFERTGKFPWQRFYLPGGKDIWEFHHGPYEDCLRDWQKRGCRIVKGRGVSSA